MIKIKRLPEIIILTLIFILASCSDEPSERKNEKAFIGVNSHAVSEQQTWIRSKKPIKISEAYIPYSENHDVYPVYESSSGEPVKAGAGTITNGILSFTIDDISGDDSLLLDWSDLQYYIPTLTLWKDVKCDPEIKGNAVSLLACSSGGDEYDSGITRERITGTSSTITCETIMYIYVDNDCTITGTSTVGNIPNNYFYFTNGNTELSLKKGLNMICGSETYSKYNSGAAKLSLEVRNPLENPEQFKWVIQNFK